MGGINLYLHEGNRNCSEISAMWLVIVVVLSVGLGILALIGLLAVARELFGASSVGASFMDAEGATGRQDDAHAYGRHRVMPH